MTLIGKLLEKIEILEKELENNTINQYNETTDNQNSECKPQQSDNKEDEVLTNVVDLTNYFEKTPSIQDVKEFLNKIVQEGKQYSTLSPDWIVEIPSSSKKKDHIAKSNNFKFMNKAQKKRHNKYIMALEDLLLNAQYTGESPNKKPLEKPNVAKYHYFQVEAKIGENTYEIIFDTEEYIGDNTTKPQTVHLYNVKEK